MSGEDRGKRKGRGRGDEVPSEELGWIEDLRQAREQGGDLGPGTDEEPAPPAARANRRGLLGGRVFGGADPAPGGGPGGGPGPGSPSGPAPESGGSWRERREARRGADQREDSRWAGLRSPEPGERPRDEPRRDAPPRRDESRRDEPRRAAQRRDEPRRDEPRRDEPRRDEPRRDEPRRDEPRRDEPRRDGPRASDLPGEPRPEGGRGLGGRFASLRGLRGADRGPDRGPAVPAPAVPPLPPEVLNPGRGVPPVPDRPAERTRPHRDPDQPGRHETGAAPGRPVSGPPVSGGSARPVSGGPSSGRPVSGPPGGRPEPGALAPGRPGPAGRRPVPPPLARPGEPSWHDLATGEKRPIGPRAAGGRTAGAAAPPGGPVEPGPAPRRSTGEHAPVPPRREQPPHPPRREQPPVAPRRGTGEQPPVGMRRPTGEQAALNRPSVDLAGDRPAGRRTQLRQQVREARRFRLVMLAAVAVVLLAALPAIFLIRDAAGDPVFAGLDSLTLPGWARQSHVDLASGSRWCVETCRLRERTWRSVKPAADTDPVYERALTLAGWHPWHSAGCPSLAGVYSCWQRDEYVLDLWTRDAPCDLANVAPAPGTSSSAPDPNASQPIPTPTGSEPPATCTGSLVTAKVANRADPNWHR